MNILQILPSLDVGGVETGTVDLARYLMARGHKAIVVSGGGRLVKELDKINVRHYKLPVGKKSVFTVFKMVRALADIIRAEDIDIVHARSRVPALIAFFACRMTQRVFITTAHGYYKKHPLSEVMGWGRYVIVASHIMAKHMMHDFGVPYERIRLIPRGVDLDRFHFKAPSAEKKSSFTIGMVSRITPLKGHADFIKAASLVSRQIPGLKVKIVGEAPKVRYREDIELLVRRLGLVQTVEFAGAREDVPSVMKDLDMLVSATVTPEAFGRVIIEAQAVGVPVVATRVGGVVDIIDDGKSGLLCDPSDYKDMADKIIRLYKDRDLRLSIITEARKKVESDFGVDKMIERTIAVYEEAVKANNILVIKMSAAGDVILSVPSLRAIRAKFPSANIKVLVGLPYRQLLDRCPYINDRIVCDFKDKHKGVAGFLRLADELRKGWFDIVIDLQNNKKSHLLAYMSMAPLRYGYDNKKFSFLLNRRIKDDAPYLDPVEHQSRTLKTAGVKLEDKRLELWPSKDDESEAEKFLSDNWIVPSQPIAGMHLRASSKWPTKNLPPSHIAELCDMLAKEFNIRTVLTGSKDDAELANRIAHMTKSKPIVAAGKTSMLELACLIRRMKVYVTPDSAPMHIASAMGTPFVAIFGPTDPARHLPPAEKFIVLKKELKCSPCYSPRCMKKILCMRKITAGEVFEAMKRFLV